MPAEQIEFIKKSAECRKQAISIRLDPAQIKAAKRIAARKSIAYQTQLRMWIAEGLTREAQPQNYIPQLTQTPSCTVGGA